MARYGQDFTQVERLGGPPMLDGMTPEAGLLVGEALHELGSVRGGRGGAAAAEAAASDDDPELVHVVEIRARNLMWGLRPRDEALAVNRRRPRPARRPRRAPRSSR